jgi:hypothetical protein
VVGQFSPASLGGDSWLAASSPVRVAGHQRPTLEADVKKACRTSISALLIALVASAMLFASSSALAAKPQLCKHESCGGKAGAWEQAEKDARSKWGGVGVSVFTTSCSNEYENVPEKTQFACYGSAYFEGVQIFTWQINLDPYGNITYQHKS